MHHRSQFTASRFSNSAPDEVTTTYPTHSARRYTETKSSEISTDMFTRNSSSTSSDSDSHEFVESDVISTHLRLLRTDSRCRISGSPQRCSPTPHPSLCSQGPRRRSGSCSRRSCRRGPGSCQRRFLFRRRPLGSCTRQRVLRDRHHRRTAGRSVRSGHLHGSHHRGRRSPGPQRRSTDRPLPVQQPACQGPAFQ